MSRLPHPATDLPAMRATHAALRQAYTQISRLQSRDPAIPVTLDRLDEMLVELSVEIEAAEQDEMHPAE